MKPGKITEKKEICDKEMSGVGFDARMDPAVSGLAVGNKSQSCNRNCCKCIS
jgi:hypothetical protein